MTLTEDASALSPTEQQIVRLIREQFFSKEIADRLCMGEKTVENYRNRIYDKVGVKNMAGIALYAIRSGLFKV